MLTIRNLKRPGLQPASLTLGEGECLAITGASGSGKTLLLRAIADLDLNHGDVRLDAEARDQMPAPRWRRLVTYVAPEAGWWSDRVDAHFPDRSAATDMLPRLGFSPDMLTAPLARLSTGERQRLALARALVRTPRVLLLDEPTSNLDSTAAGQVETVLRRHLDRGTGVLLVTHDEGQAERIADRLLAICDGRLSDPARRYRTSSRS